MFEVRDISKWQEDSIVSKTVASSNVKGFICKATEGETYHDPKFEHFVNDCIQYKKHIGAYHFARAWVNSPVKEAENFVNRLKELDLVGRVLMCLDMEGKSLEYPDFALDWFKQVYDMTGLKGVLYVQQNDIWRFEECKNFGVGLWVARWSEKPGEFGSMSPWGSWMLHQYSTAGGTLDHDVFNGDDEMWNDWCTPNKSTIPDEGDSYCGCCCCCKKRGNK